MKRRLVLGPAGVRALVALCDSVERNGNAARDARWIARVLLSCCGAAEEIDKLGESELSANSGRSSSYTTGPLKRLKAARAELEDMNRVEAARREEADRRKLESEQAAQGDEEAAS